MDQQTLSRTRRALHGVAELVLAGPQYADEPGHPAPGDTGRVRHRRRARPPGRAARAGQRRPPGCPLGGTFAELARAAGVEARALRDVYADGPGVSPGDTVSVDPDAAGVILDAFAAGDAALRDLAPDEQPVLWPEHFDVGISLAEVNYGVSPGDARIPEPYAYVGPWTLRDGGFWNQPFGAARRIAEAGDVEALVAFFREGARRAAADPPAAPRPDDGVRHT